MTLFKQLPLYFAAIALAVLTACSSTPTQESTGEFITDTALTTKVKAAVFAEPTLSALEINVETFKGTVQLSGFVNSQTDINKAMSVARDVKGVKSVKNSMRLK